MVNSEYSIEVFQICMQNCDPLGPSTKNSIPLRYVNAISNTMNLLNKKSICIWGNKLVKHEP